MVLPSCYFLNGGGEERNPDPHVWVLPRVRGDHLRAECIFRQLLAKANRLKGVFIGIMMIMLLAVPSSSEWSQLFPNYVIFCSPSTSVHETILSQLKHHNPNWKTKIPLLKHHPGPSVNPAGIGGLASKRTHSSAARYNWHKLILAAWNILPHLKVI